MAGGGAGGRSPVVGEDQVGCVLCLLLGCCLLAGAVIGLAQLFAVVRGG